MSKQIMILHADQSSDENTTIKSCLHCVGLNACWYFSVSFAPERQHTVDIICCL